MKRIFYGIEKERDFIANLRQLHEFANVVYYESNYIVSLEHLIKILEYNAKDNYTSFISESLNIITTEHHINERDLDMELIIGDKIIIDKNEGVIVSRVYDFENNAIHYFTDITFIRELSGDEEEKLKLNASKDVERWLKSAHCDIESLHIRLNVLKEREVYEARNEKKGFFTRLLEKIDTNRRD